jgi:DeoR family fructose operon transcriptional repressor
MYDIERQEKILEILKKEKSCSVAKLAKRLNYSEATIRRDLNALDKELKVRKTFGGAVIFNTYNSEVPIAIRRPENAELKKKICQAAASLIKENMTILLDASTTTEYLVPFFKLYKNLTIITNNPDIPQMLADTDLTVYSTGGKYLHHSNSYVGEFARGMLRGINADIVFFSARGIGYDGKVTVSSTDDDIHKAMIENSAKTCLMADSTKFGKTHPFTICNISEVDYVVTDKPLPPQLEHKNVIY